MQEITFYTTANETLGVVRDFANARTVSAPTLTRGVSVALHMRLFDDANDLEPYPIAAFSNIAAWSFVMDDDFNDETAFKIVADNVNISVSDVEEEYTDPADPEITQTRHYTEFTIPIPDMNSEALAAWFRTSSQSRAEAKSKGGLIGELVGFDTNGASVFVLQIEGFTVRNRLTGSGEPSGDLDQYLTIDEARAMFIGEGTKALKPYLNVKVLPSDEPHFLDGVYYFHESIFFRGAFRRNVYIREGEDYGERCSMIQYNEATRSWVILEWPKTGTSSIKFFYPWTPCASSPGPVSGYFFPTSGSYQAQITRIPRFNISAKKY